MNKEQLINLVIPEEHRSKVDTAVPSDWFLELVESEKKAGLQEIINPAFKYAYSYIDQRFGEPINLVDMLVSKISKKEIYIISEKRYMELLKDSEQLREHLND